MKMKPNQKSQVGRNAQGPRPAQKPAIAPQAAPGDEAEGHLGATEEQVGDRTGSGAGYDQPERPRKKPAKGGVSS